MAYRFARHLSVEIPSWVRDGLISAEQAERVLARYPVSPAWFTRPVAVFSIIGGALIAAALVLVVAHNWADIPRGGKLAGVVALLVIAHLAGLALRDRGYTAAGEGVLVIGGSLLLAGIALIGQIYNLSGRDSDAVLLWWLLLLPAAYALPSIALAVLASLGATWWYGAILFDRTTWLGADLEGSGVLGAVAVAAGGLLAFGAGALHGDGAYRRVRQFLEQLGLLALAGAFVALGFLGKWLDVYHGRGPARLVALLVLAAVVVAASALRLPPDAPRLRAGLPAVLLVLVLYLAVVVAAVVMRAPASAFRLLAWGSWVLLFGLSIALILYGARWERPSWINWGVVFIGVNAVARYLELVGTMLQTSLLFFVTGLFVLALGWSLERLRRRMTAQSARPPGSA